VAVVDKLYQVRNTFLPFDRRFTAVAAAKTADLILVMLDATKSEEQKRLLEIELDAVGIRLNKKKPDVVFKKKTTGGVSLPFLLYP
jgi:ribosome-interacting GTPase 1